MGGRERPHPWKRGRGETGRGRDEREGEPCHSSCQIPPQMRGEGQARVHVRVTLCGDGVSDIYLSQSGVLPGSVGSAS